MNELEQPKEQPLDRDKLDYRKLVDDINVHGIQMRNVYMSSKYVAYEIRDSGDDYSHQALDVMIQFSRIFECCKGNISDEFRSHHQGTFKAMIDMLSELLIKESKD